MFKIRKTDILDNILSGMEDHALMEKYRIPLKLYQRLLQRLVDEKALSHSDLYERSAVYRDITDTLVPRRYPRVYLPMPVRVYDYSNSAAGLIRDISENGLRVAGIEAKAGENMCLSIPLTEIGGIGPVRLEAICRWSEKRGKQKKFVMSGFEVTHISEETRCRLQSFIDFLHAQSAPQATLAVCPDEPTAEASVTKKEETGKPRHFSGTLGQVDILDVVHFLLLNAKQMVLHVRSNEGKQAWLYLIDRNVVHARMGNREGIDAFFACMDFPGGEFSAQSWSEPPRRSIDFPGEFLLMEAARFRDESSEELPPDCKVLL